MIIPYEQINPTTLERLVEEFITREGTEYGSQDATLASKVEEVLTQIRQGVAVIVYDAETQTCNVIKKSSLL